MGRKGWALLAVCVVAVVVIAVIFYARSRQERLAALKAQGQADSLAAAPSAATSATEAAQDGSIQSGQGTRVVTYVVRRGDTLGAISRRYLGSSTRWHAIAKENRLRGARIKPGMKLHITVCGLSGTQS